MTLEICTNCGEPTGRAGRHEDSLYAGDFGPYCDECWTEVPNDLAEELIKKQRIVAAKDAEIARLWEYLLETSGRLRQIVSDPKMEMTAQDMRDLANDICRVANGDAKMLLE